MHFPSDEGGTEKSDILKRRVSRVALNFEFVVLLAASNFRDSTILQNSSNHPALCCCSYLLLVKHPALKLSRERTSNLLQPSVNNIPSCLLSIDTVSISLDPATFLSHRLTHSSSPQNGSIDSSFFIYLVSSESAASHSPIFSSLLHSPVIMTTGVPTSVRHHATTDHRLKM